MKPGRELDALVAEKVMGWKHDTDKNKNAWLVDGVYFCETEPWSSRRCENSDLFDECRAHNESLPWEHGWPCTLPNFSTDIKAAWEVAENFRQTGIELSLNNSGSKEEVWCVQVFHRDTQMWKPGVWAKSAPHAICLAALTAVGAIEEKT